MANQWTNVTLAARFAAQYTVCQETGCWLWAGVIGGRGYGMIKDNYRTRLAHRVAYELRHGRPIPPGQIVCHRCDTPRCVNPVHLFLGTTADNNRDKAEKGRAYRPTGALHPQAKLCDADVVAIRESPARNCDLARLFAVAPSTVSRIKSGKGWGHIG